jgi:hypothetical protein
MSDHGEQKARAVHPVLDLMAALRDSLRERGMADGDRLRDGKAIQDGCIIDPKGCPRGLGDCFPLARYSSPAFESFVCCGETHAAPMPSDRLRLCQKSTHAHGVDILVNLDERDVVHTATVLMAGLSALGSVKITAEDGTEPRG